MPMSWELHKAIYMYKLHKAPASKRATWSSTVSWYACVILMHAANGMQPSAAAAITSATLGSESAIGGPSSMLAKKLVLSSISSDSTTKVCRPQKMGWLDDALASPLPAPMPAPGASWWSAAASCCPRQSGSAGCELEGSAGCELEWGTVATAFPFPAAYSTTSASESTEVK